MLCPNICRQINIVVIQYIILWYTKISLELPYKKWVEDLRLFFDIKFLSKHGSRPCRDHTRNSYAPNNWRPMRFDWAPELTPSIWFAITFYWQAFPRKNNFCLISGRPVKRT